MKIFFFHFSCLCYNNIEDEEKISSCILCMTDMEPKVAGDVPLIAVFGILFSIALAIFAVRKLWNMKKNKK